jgi:competence protein ComGD
MRNQSGFTLIEILLVFSVFLVIASVSAILLRPQYLLFEKERFYSQFKADLLYSQQYAIAQQKNISVYIVPIESRYYVKEKLTNKYIVDRKVPETITFEQGTLGTMRISFDYDPSGEMNQFGTLIFSVGGQRYKITFQIGVGRFYVVKE